MDLILDAVIGLSIFISFFIAFLSIFLKAYFQLKYKSLIMDQTNNFDKSEKEDSLISLNGLFELFVPIFIRAREMESENINIKKTGKKIRILLFLFYSCLTYFFVTVGIK